MKYRILKQLKKILPIIILLVGFSVSFVSADVTNTFWKKIGSNDIWTTGTSAPQGQAIIHIGGCILEPSGNPCSGGGGGGVTQIVAGSNVTITPSGGTGVVTINASGGSGAPGGLNTQLQYNNSGVFGGITGAVTDGTAVSLTAAHLLNPTINGAGTGLATLVYPNTTSSPTITFPTATGTLALSVNGIAPDAAGNITVPVGGAPASPDRSIQINNAGAFGSQGWSIDTFGTMLGGGGTNPNSSTNAVSFGNSDGGALNVNGDASVSMGIVDSDAGSTIESGPASIAAGSASNGSSINSSANSIVIGMTDGIGSALSQNSSNDAIIHGQAINGGSIEAYFGNGSEASGVADGTGSAINVFGSGGKAFGDVASGAQIVNDAASETYGSATNGGRLSTSTDGSLVHGVTTGGTISSEGQGDEVAGVVDDNAASLIDVSGDGSMSIGSATEGANITSNNNGSIASGFASGDDGMGNVSSISTGGDGSIAGGDATVGGFILATSTGSYAHGAANGSDGAGNPSFLIAEAGGATASGFADAGASIIASATGDTSTGQAVGVSGTGTRSSILSGAAGSFATGDASGGGTITAGGNGSISNGQTEGGTIDTNSSGSIASGVVDGNAASLLKTSGDGTIALGYANAGGKIVSQSNGSIAAGNSGGDDGLGNISTISTNGSGAIATGFTSSGATIFANGDGAWAHGAVGGNDGAGAVGSIDASGTGSYAAGVTVGSGQILAQGESSFAQGSVATSGNSITASGSDSFVFGNDNFGSLIASATGTFALGSGITNSTANSFMAGYGQQQIYADSTLLTQLNGGTGSFFQLNPDGTIVGNGLSFEFDSYDGSSIAGGSFGINAVSSGGVLIQSHDSQNIVLDASPDESNSSVGMDMGGPLLINGDGGTSGYVLTSQGPGAAPIWAAGGGGGSGTVTSVGLALPSIFTVSGSPVTSSGTLTGTLNTQAANLVFAGPTTGSAAAPTFRSLVAADLPNAGVPALTSTQIGFGSGSNLLTSDSNFTYSTSSGLSVGSSGNTFLRVFATGAAQFQKGSASIGMNSASQVVIQATSGMLVDGALGNVGDVVTSGGSGSTVWSAKLNTPHTIFTPTTGGTVNLVDNKNNIINPAGALLALTVNLPAAPANGDTVYIKFTQSVTTVTYTGGTVVDPITSPVAAGLVVLTFDTGTSSWY